jgi:hypothetical protein
MRLTILLMLFVMLLSGSAIAGDITLAGTWKFNPAKSHFTHGDLPLSLVITITADGPNGIQYQSKNHLVDGSTGGASYRAKLGGKDYPVTGSPSYDAVAIRPVNPNTFHIEMKKGGAVIVDTMYVVAADGRTMTRKGTAKKGAEVNQFDELFERQ